MEKKLKIAMIGHKRIPSREGGVEVVVEELSSRMVRNGNSVTCYNRSGHHISGKEFDRKKAKEHKGIRLKYVFTVNIKGLAAMTSSICGAICCAFSRYDVVHFHAEGPCAMLWLPKLFGKKCIATIHGIDWQRAKWGKLARRYIKHGEKIAVKYADKIIVLSKEVQNYFMNTYGRKTILIPNGVNSPVFRDAKLIKQKYNLNKDEYILFVGRLVPEKGIKYLIQAFKQADIEKKLVIAGGSSDTDAYMQELKELADGDDRIIFTGFVQGQMLEELYSNAYLYCLPSDLEGMPLSLLEAMSYGNCCLTSDIPECMEVMEDKGLSFKKADVDALKDKLCYACNHPEEVQKLKIQASKYIQKKYNWDDVVERTMGLYMEDN